MLKRNLNHEMQIILLGNKKDNVICNMDPYGYT